MDFFIIGVVRSVVNPRRSSQLTVTENRLIIPASGGRNVSLTIIDIFDYNTGSWLLFFGSKGETMPSKLDVLFVIPSVRTVGAYGSVKKDAIEPPAKARFMAAYLLRRNVSVDLVDANVTDDTPELMAAKVKDADPVLAVMPVYGFNPSSSTQTMPSAHAYAKAIKELSPTTPIIMSGTHPAALPERT